MSAIQPGDLLFYASGNYINHVAIYIGDGKNHPLQQSDYGYHHHQIQLPYAVQGGDIPELGVSGYE